MTGLSRSFEIISRLRKATHNRGPKTSKRPEKGRLFYSAPAVINPWIYGDFTGNRILDLDDLAGFIALWLMADCQSLADFDVNADCLINRTEFAELAKNWMK